MIELSQLMTRHPALVGRIAYRAESGQLCGLIPQTGPKDGADAELGPANVELLRDALEFITEHPEAHNQRHWFGWRDAPDFSEMSMRPEVIARVKARQEAEEATRVPALADTACGTTGCLFGWAAVLDGANVVVTTDRAGGHPVALLELDDPDYGGDWGAVGRERLGLNYRNGGAISAPRNTVGDLWRMASIITGGEITVPAEFARYDGLTAGQEQLAIRLENYRSELRAEGLNPDDLEWFDPWNAEL